MLKIFTLLPNIVAGGERCQFRRQNFVYFSQWKMGFTKGKAEQKETIDQTALREVEEETGEGFQLQNHSKLRIIFLKEMSNIS